MVLKGSIYFVYNKLYIPSNIKFSHFPTIYLMEVIYVTNSKNKGSIEYSDNQDSIKILKYHKDKIN